MEGTVNMILDLGSDTVKAGTSADALPALKFPSVVGRAVKKRKLLMKARAEESPEGTQILVGLDALLEGRQSALERPIKHGIIENWPLFEHIAGHCFNELGLEAESTTVTITEPVYNPRRCAETLAQTYFETFNIPAMALLPSGVCALYASGRSTGIVLDSGEGVTQVTPVFDSSIIMNATNRINCGGLEVTEHLKRILAERGYTFDSSHDQLAAQAMKEQLCYVAQNYEEELTQDEPIASYALPDGQSIEAGHERFRAPEILFSPTIIQSEVPSLQDFVVEAVKRSPIDIRKPLLANIVVCGGNTLFNGFGSRLKNEVTRNFPGLFSSICVVEGAERLYSTFSGAAVVAQLPTFSERLVTRAMYDEEGPGIIRDHVGGSVEEAPE